MRNTHTLLIETDGAQHNLMLDGHGGMITSTIHVLILVPVFFALMKERALRMELDNRWNQNEARSKRVWFSFSRAFAWQFKINE